ncbi:MAG: ComEA family DNA-binding protein [Caldimonas sp.]
MIGAIVLAAAGLPGIAAAATAGAARPASAPTSMPAAQAIPGHPSLAASQRNRPKVVDHYVDINSAGRKELMTLPGIGAAEADKIVANRPYLTKTELVTKKVLPAGPFFSIRHRIVAMQKFKSKGKG